MSTVVISGASKGIGKAAAAQFSEAGHLVFNLSRTPANLPGIENVQIDLAGAQAVQEVAAFADSLKPGVFHLIHNAARLTSETVRSDDIDNFRSVININVIAPQILNAALLPKMNAGSSIIYIGSTLSEKAVPNSFSYVVTKHAMIGMMRATCQDLAGSGIHTACVCPGFTNTEMLRAHVGDSQEILDSIAAGSTFGRLVEPNEIARTICFAADNPVINGAIIHANLGQIEN
ncbi:MAG: SDR family oxidoreductase [Gammaproteobacteria bacterium]|jgi:3-oxoacyl-[acyl-carrier protein] reductase|nr:SDR family oxidoreductase [Gammaproteobacteria bacterium]MBT5154225.1 SDR family oxidoreductase [Gammaproteobacteria bacterium]MBT5725507.1 SDR family oxidoreductase [Gammaproteobacteria bacterium]MBT6891675.1 SDR family oxidoreductase [Gammaproteobacteria bacterium]MBT7879055.1 SDR family oxidoreductase [Gammaproteobacteria bacterium]